jgi:hypothetical protein
MLLYEASIRDGKKEKKRKEKVKKPNSQGSSTLVRAPSGTDVRNGVAYADA